MSDEEPVEDLRTLWQSADGGEPPSLLDLRRRARALQRRVFWRNLREYAAVAPLTFVWVFVGYHASGAALLRAACVLLVAGGAAVAVQLARRGAGREAPAGATTAEHVAFLRGELVRQRDLLRDVWRWYLAPFVPGVVLFLVAIPLEAPLPGASGPLWAASAAGAAIVALVFCAVSRLNSAGARHLQQEIEGLDQTLPPVTESGE